MPPLRKFYSLEPGQSLAERRKRDGISLCEYLDYLDRLEQHNVQHLPDNRMFENLSEEDIKAQELLKKLMGALNKLAPDNFYIHLMELQDNIPVRSSHLMQIFMRNFVLKAIYEELWSQLYAHVCKALENIELQDIEKPHIRTFKDFLLDECSTQFCFYRCPINWWKLEPPTNEDIQNISVKDDEKRRSLAGLMRFIGDLYKAEVIGEKDVYCYIGKLRKETNEKNVEAMAKLLQACGKELESSLEQSEGEWVDIWESIVKMARKESGFPQRIRFILMDLLDLMNGGWVPRFSSTRPKTFVELLFDVRNESKSDNKRKDVEKNVSSAEAISPMEKQLSDVISDDPVVVDAEKKLMAILKSTSDPYKLIHDWEIDNFKGRKICFVYSLARALLRISIVGNSLDGTIFHGKIDILKKYVNSRQTEVACMYAVQYIVVAEMGNPKGLLYQVCQVLYKSSTVSYVGFLDWRENWSKNPVLEVQGKAQAQVTLAKFFIELFWESIKPSPQYKSIIGELNSFDLEHFVSTSKLPPEIGKRIKMEEEREINKLKKKDQLDSPRHSMPPKSF